MSLDQLVRSCRRRWATIAIGAVLGTLGGLGYATLAPTTYQARTQLFVTTTARTADGQISPDAASAEERARSYARLATSEQVLSAVIQDLRLPITAADLATRIQASAEPGTVLIDIRARDGVPEQARDIATKVGEHLPVVVRRLETLSGGTAGTADTAPVEVRVTSAAALPTEPASPKRLLALLIGLLGGTALGVLAATAQVLLDRRLRTRAEIVRHTGVPVLAEIPEHPTALATFAGEGGADRARRGLPPAALAAGPRAVRAGPGQRAGDQRRERRGAHVHRLQPGDRPGAQRDRRGADRRRPALPRGRHHARDA